MLLIVFFSVLVYVFAFMFVVYQDIFISNPDKVQVQVLCLGSLLLGLFGIDCKCVFLCVIVFAFVRRCSSIFSGVDSYPVSVSPWHCCENKSEIIASTIHLEIGWGL